MIAMHLGADHPLETALVLLLAFGPFIILGVVVVIMRRRDAHEVGVGRVREGTSSSDEDVSPET